jgi:hypothetical protein
MSVIFHMIEKKAPSFENKRRLEVASFLSILILGVHHAHGQKDVSISDTFPMSRLQQVILEPMIGFPSTGNYVVKNAGILNEAKVLTSKNTSIPVQIGGRFEYMIKHRFGMALEGSYERCGFSRTVYYVDPLTNFMDSSVTLTETWAQSSSRFLLRFQYHPVQREKLDVYIGIGAGCVLRKTGSRPEDLNPTLEPDQWNELLLERMIEPLTARVFLGGRVQLSKKFGLSAEAGLGAGAAFQAGFFARLE